MKIKEIYIKRILRHTKEGQGFYCSEVYKINKGLPKDPLELLLRNNKPVYILEKEKVSIPTSQYPLARDYEGEHKLLKVLGVSDRFNIELHVGNYLYNTKGCLLMGQNFDPNFEYGSQDIIIDESLDTCNWFINDFLLNDEENKQTRRVDQDEIIGRITINA